MVRIFSGFSEKYFKLTLDFNFGLLKITKIAKTMNIMIKKCEANLKEVLN